MRNTILILLFTLAMSLVSCDEETPTKTDPVKKSTMTAIVNSANWEAAAPHYNKYFRQLTGKHEVNESEINTNDITILFSIENGHPIVGEQVVQAIYEEIRGGNSLQWEDELGICNVTSFSDDNIEGTFSFRVEPTGSNTEAMKVITGEFDIVIKGELE